MKKTICIVAWMALCFAVHAQTVIRGKVLDAGNQAPLPGATILYGSTKILTSADGSFTLDCGITSSLTASYIGYEKSQVSIKNCDEQLTIFLSQTSGSLERIEITATSNQNKTILYQPQSITKIGTTEIRRGTGLFLDDAINTNVPGVMMQRRSVSAGQQFNIRGYGNGLRGTNGISSNFDGQGYKVYLNGIPITDAEGITLMDDIDFGPVGNVEVLKGPSGTLYGLAIAGVVNLKTTRPAAGKTSISQEALIGRYGLKRFTTSFSMGAERSAILLNYGYQETDGYMTHTASTKRFVNFVGDFTINDKQSISTYVGHSNSYDQRGGELFISQYDNNDYSGNAAYIKNNAHSEVLSFRGGITHTYKLNEHFSNNTTFFGTAQATNASSAGGWTDKNPINYGLRSTVDTRFQLGTNVALSGITGIETQAQYAETIGYVMGTNPANPAGDNIITSTRSNQNTRSGTLSLFTEWTVALPDDLSITAGIGTSNMKIELNDRIYVAGKPSYYYRKYDGMVSPHVAVNKVFGKGFSLYGSYSQGYKAPVSSYFFIPFTGEVNTTLEPEKGVQFEVGSKGLLLGNKLSYEVAVFQAHFKNKMASVAVPNSAGTATAYSYIVNSGEQDNKGVELAVKYTLYNSPTGLLRMVRPFVNATYSDFRYKNYKFQTNALLPPTEYDGKQVAGFPKKIINIGVDANATAGIYLNIVYNYRDAFPLTSDGLVNGNPYHVSSYNLLNGKLGVRQSVSAHFDVDAFFGVTNITGQKYYYMVFVNQLQDAYLPAPKDPFYFGGLSLRYHF